MGKVVGKGDLSSEGIIGISGISAAKALLLMEIELLIVCDRVMRVIASR